MSGRRVLKFTLAVEAVTVIETADELRFLAVGAQYGNIVVWAEASVGSGVRTTLLAVMTGETVPDDAEYIGTGQLGGWRHDEPPYTVVHVYRSTRSTDGADTPSSNRP
jgi:hypothetical protein